MLEQTRQTPLSLYRPSHPSFPDGAVEYATRGRTASGLWCWVGPQPSGPGAMRAERLLRTPGAWRPGLERTTTPSDRPAAGLQQAPNRHRSRPSSTGPLGSPKRAMQGTRAIPNVCRSRAPPEPPCCVDKFDDRHRSTGSRRSHLRPGLLRSAALATDAESGGLVDHAGF
jgi:hypothetical protein